MQNDLNSLILITDSIWYTKFSILNLFLIKPQNTALFLNWPRKKRTKHEGYVTESSVKMYLLSLLDAQWCLRFYRRLLRYYCSKYEHSKIITSSEKKTVKFIDSSSNVKIIICKTRAVKNVHPLHIIYMIITYHNLNYSHCFNWTPYIICYVYLNRYLI